MLLERFRTHRVSAILNFQKPQALGASNKVYSVTKFRESCIQGGPSDQHWEDCLFLNVIRPAVLNSTATGKLPVMVWIHGGGFQWGSGNIDGTRLVAESIALNAPIIFVSMNYRLGAFGFLGGSAMLSAAKSGAAALNVGMYDTRFALRWVHSHIAAFGGDPRRVTLAGQSAGAFIVGNTLLSNGQKTGGLYQAAIMDSGSPGSASTLPPDHPRLDQTFSQIARAVGCPTEDPNLACLKSISAAKLGAASYAMVQSFSKTPQLGLFPFMPLQDFQVDGFWFSAPPHRMVHNGQIATVPVISGVNLDEGTDGAPKDLDTSDAFKNWVRKVAFVDTSDSSLANKVMTNLLRLFPDDVRAGSPFPNTPTGASAGNTDPSNPFFQPASNQFKRAASFYGAWRYIAPHRKFLQARVAAKSGEVWSYLFAQQDRQVEPYRGVTHSAELPYVFGNVSDMSSAGFYAPLSRTIQRAWISFVNYHDPRRIHNLDWPPYTASGQLALELKGQAVGVIKDTYRSAQLAYIKSNDASTVLSS
ncbi:hypothetical protein V8E36_009786 [Tilletia maclaganii]